MICEHAWFDLEPLEGRRLLSATLLKDIAPGKESTFPHDFVVMNGKAYFQVLNAGFEWSLWRTDGTSGGTVQVAAVSYGGTIFTTGQSRQVPVDVVVAPGHYGFGNLTVVGGALYAYDTQPAGSHEVGVSVERILPNGTRTTTYVGQLSTSLPDAHLGRFRDVNGTAYFFFGDGDEAQWYAVSFDGTAIRASDPTNGDPDATAPDDSSAWSATLGNKQVFSAFDAAHGWELWSARVGETLPTHQTTLPDGAVLAGITGGGGKEITTPPSTGTGGTGTTASPTGATISLTNGVLRINGTGLADIVDIHLLKGHANWLEVVLNGSTTRYAASKVRQIVINASGGADKITESEVNGKIRIATSVLGGTGNDTITTAGGDDVIYGGAGVDLIDAGAGTNHAHADG